MWHPNIEFFFLYPAFSKWFKLFCGWCLVSYWYHANVPSCPTFSISSTFHWLSTRAKCIFDIKISRSKMLESALCHTYCIMSKTSQIFLAAWVAFFPFCNKISECIKFLLYFHSFSRRNNFWLNKQVSQLFF